jgi:MerR family transcriptional regulator, thiopeptide resistance regulator
VTVRTLHHYDEIGLLKPANIGSNGYRYYERKELLRLQRILFHRELGVPLSNIAELLEFEGKDQIGVLQQHRKKLSTERERYRLLIENIDKTISELEGQSIMSNEDLYRGFSPEKQAGYESWLVERYGQPIQDSIVHIKSKNAKRNPAENKAFIEAMMNELHQVETALADCLRETIDPASDRVDELIARHRAWVAGMWYRPCSTNSYSGLADLYLAHPDFIARYEQIENGFSDYLAKAMKLHAEKHCEDATD